MYVGLVIYFRLRVGIFFLRYSATLYSFSQPAKAYLNLLKHDALLHYDAENCKTTLVYYLTWICMIIQDITIVIKTLQDKKNTAFERFQLKLIGFC